MAMTDDEKKLTAYHEAGHALVGLHVPQHDPLHKVTIIPRGRALGLTMNLPEQDKLSYTRQYCVSKIASMFGGREAEVLVFGPENVTNGATSDIQQATRMARAMIMEWGMSEKLGRVRYRANEQEVFLGHSVAQSNNMSEETAKLIDGEVRELIENGEQTARRILTEHRDQLDLIARGLLEYETLSGDEVANLLKGIAPIRTPYDEPGSTSKPEGPSVPAVGKPRPSAGPGPIISPEPQPR
jgi:cell division protease FtsH